MLPGVTGGHADTARSHHPARERAKFDEVFRRVVDAKLPYGDSFRAVGNTRGPGDETGSRGPGKAVYFFDLSKNLIDIRHYETSSD